MKAMDVMNREVVTVGPDTDISEAAKLLTEHDISALPVVDGDRHVVGILSEADLMRREEIDTGKQRPWWLEAVTPASTLAEEFTKSHGKKVSEVMSDSVISASEDASLAEIATILERNRIKRVPILRNGELVGVVSRANLIQALASSTSSSNDQNADRTIRLALLTELDKQPWTDFGSRNVIVSDGTVHIWGLVSSEQERRALVALAETIPDVKNVADEMIPAY
ncbi:CBS domain-containing protein [Roseiarcaceae bacterium H3SJ34-1]|uniref:CBS domain-containing protein n=1 Tax=Terripilifer ovatus TaxID=3032367 RepID=UPI003AB9BC1D|nr:CBS domain-containing protein [Roseiarcaceae bacterium H3SJ34-1]